MKTTGVKPVLLTGEQVAALQAIREQERQRSGFGIAPSIHDVARKVIEMGLKHAGVTP